MARRARRSSRSPAGRRARSPRASCPPFPSSRQTHGPPRLDSRGGPLLFAKARLSRVDQRGVAPPGRIALLPAVLALLALASPAWAGTVSSDGSTLTYTAAPGEANRVTLSASFSTVTVSESGSVPVTAGAGCTSTGASSATCPALGITAISVWTGDSNDTARVNGYVPATFHDGAGNDTIYGGSAGDTFVSEGGGDSLRGGAGVDAVDYSSRTAAVSVSYDGIANDGESGEGDYVYTDVENVVGGAGDDTVGGSSAGNFLDGGPGDDTLSGAGGNDRLTGGAGADAVNGGTEGGAGRRRAERRNGRRPRRVLGPDGAALAERRRLGQRRRGRRARRHRGR